MDLSTVWQKLKNDGYVCAADVYEDIDQIWKNCFLYNDEHSQVVVVLDFNETTCLMHLLVCQVVDFALQLASRFNAMFSEQILSCSTPPRSSRSSGIVHPSSPDAPPIALSQHNPHDYGSEEAKSLVNDSTSSKRRRVSNSNSSGHTHSSSAGGTPDQTRPDQTNQDQTNQDQTKQARSRERERAIYHNSYIC